jgi:hypothetical protein
MNELRLVGHSRAGHSARAVVVRVKTYRQKTAEWMDINSPKNDGDGDEREDQSDTSPLKQEAKQDL